MECDCPLKTFARLVKPLVSRVIRRIGIVRLWRSMKEVESVSMSGTPETASFRTSVTLGGECLPGPIGSASYDFTTTP